MTRIMIQFYILPFIDSTFPPLKYDNSLKSATRVKRVTNTAVNLWLHRLRF